MIDFKFFYAAGNKAVGVERDRETTVKSFGMRSEAVDFVARAERMRTQSAYDAEVFEAINSEVQARAERATP